MEELGMVEDKIFKDRQQRDLEFKARNKVKRRRERMESDQAPKWVPQGQFAPQALGNRGSMGAVQNAKQTAYDMRVAGLHSAASTSSNKDAAKAMKAMLKSGQDFPTPPPDQGKGKKRPLDSDSEEETPDEVRLYEDGFKDRYYESKFGVLPEDKKFRHRVAEEYTIGLSWVLRYYYQVNIINSKN